METDALFLSGENFTCADDLVVVSVDDLTEVAVAAQLAAALQGPFFFEHPRLSAEVGRLRPARVHLIGDVDVVAPSGTEVMSHDVDQAVDAARAALQVTREQELPLVADTSTVTLTLDAIAARNHVVRPSGPATTTSDAPIPTMDVGSVVSALASPSSASSIWLVDGTDPLAVLLSATVGSMLDVATVAVDGDDLLGYPQVSEVLAAQASIRLVGGLPLVDPWELEVLLNGQQVPGGGFHILPEDDPRRYLAFYGHPETTSLGVLGEQGPGETLTRMQTFVDDYSGDGSQVIATYEIIAAVASAGAGSDGNYSYEWPVDTFTDWVETAQARDAYIVLDIQPGRSDFLTQAKHYESLLLLPFVGLALDPEWRLGPDELPLEQIGRVDSAEVNEVITWLADLVRDNGLPQKLLLLHQFAPFMIENRENLEDRPELQVIIQVDGDGREADKDRTWERVREGFEDAFWSWGWKNFFDEDEPGPPTPESTMGKKPSPVFVSYQ